MSTKGKQRATQGVSVTSGFVDLTVNSMHQPTTFQNNTDPGLKVGWSLSNVNEDRRRPQKRKHRAGQCLGAERTQCRSCSTSCSPDFILFTPEESAPPRKRKRIQRVDGSH